MLLLMAAVGSGPARADSTPFVRFQPAKQRLEHFTKTECTGVHCKHQVRHCRRWARNQVACQSETLSWTKVGSAVTYCHWIALATRLHAGKPLQVWTETRPACSMMRRPRWPVKASG